MSAPDGPLARWSRRKQAARHGAAPQPADEPKPAPQTDPAGEPPMSEEAYLEANALPDPDTLEKGDDFTAFLREGVPDALRRRALRRLWGSNPVLANLDGLVDYGGDFTDKALVPKILSTAYTVGRGFRDPEPVDDPDSLEATEAPPPAETEPDDDPGPAEEAPVADTPTDATNPQETVATIATPPLDALPPEPEPQPVATARRMRFRSES